MLQEPHNIHVWLRRECLIIQKIILVVENIKLYLLKSELST